MPGKLASAFTTPSLWVPRDNYNYQAQRACLRGNEWCHLLTELKGGLSQSRHCTPQHHPYRRLSNCQSSRGWNLVKQAVVKWDEITMTQQCLARFCLWSPASLFFCLLVRSRENSCSYDHETFIINPQRIMPNDFGLRSKVSGTKV